MGRRTSFPVNRGPLRRDTLALPLTCEAQRAIWSPLLLVLAVLNFIFPLKTFADLTISEPSSGAVMAHCEDYFLYEWGTSLTMDGPESGALVDIPQTQQLGVSGYSYSGGSLSMTTTTSAGIVTLLSYTPVDPVHGNKGALPIGTRYGEAQPINSSKYRYFNVRMYSPQDAEAQISWREGVTRTAFTTFHVSTGWHTYTIDLASAPVAGHSVGTNLNWLDDDWEGLEFYPVNVSGVTVLIDSIQLLSATACGTYEAEFSSSSGDQYITLVLDTDTDPSNGFVEKKTISHSSGSGTVSFDSGQVGPGNYEIYGFHSNDWSTIEHLNPWDFADSGDILPQYSQQITGLTIASGRVQGTISGTSPYLELNLRDEAVDADTFDLISLSAYYSSGGTALIFFYDGPSGTPPLGSESFSVSSGWSQYVIDLSSNASWQGQITRIRIVPLNYGTSGTNFQYDFVALRSSGAVTSLAMPTLANASASLEVNALSWSFVQPDERGGKEFGQHVVGNPWNMSEIDDIRVATNVLSAEILPHNEIVDAAGNAQSGDFFRAYNITGNGDPQYPVLYFDTERCIDTTRYVNMCYRGWNSTESNGFNSVARFIWHDARNSQIEYFDGDDIIMNRVTREYCLDLRNIRHTETEPPQASGSPNRWTEISQNGSCVDFIRVDMTESTEAGHHSVIDYIHLRTDHEADTAFAIVVDAPLSQAVAFYYTSTPATSGGALIGQLAAGRETNLLLWNTSAVPDGTYYIYGSAVRAGNNLRYKAPGRVVVNHSLTADSTPPLLECERPTANQSFGPVLEIAGYALDETRLATLELLVDDEFVKRVTPSLFHLAARTAYPHYAEANNSGFHETLDISSLSTGSHVVKLVATDTAGNSSSCERTISVSPTGSYSPISYPVADADPVSYPLDGLPSPTISAKVEKKTNVVLRLKDVGVCSSVQIVGATKLDFSDAVTLMTLEPLAMDEVVSAKKLPGPKTGVKGTLRFRLLCATEDRGFAALNVRKIKGKKTKKSAAALLKTIAKKIKRGEP